MSGRIETKQNTVNDLRSFDRLNKVTIFDTAYRITFGYITVVSIIFGFILKFDMPVEAARTYLAIPSLALGITGLAASYLGVKARVLSYLLISLFIYFPLSVYKLPVYPLAPLTQVVIVFPVSVLLYLEFRQLKVLLSIALFSGPLYFFDLYIDYTYNNFIEANTLKDSLQVYGITILLVSIPFVLVGYLVLYTTNLLSKIQAQNKRLDESNKVLIDISSRNSHHIRKHLANVSGLISISSEELAEFKILEKEIEEMDNAIRETDARIRDSLEFNQSAN
jgi:hypothetical protein